MTSQGRAAFLDPWPCLKIQVVDRSICGTVANRVTFADRAGIKYLSHQEVSHGRGRASRTSRELAVSKLPDFRVNGTATCLTLLGDLDAADCRSSQTVSATRLLWRS